MISLRQLSLATALTAVATSTLAKNIYIDKTIEREGVSIRLSIESIEEADVSQHIEAGQTIQIRLNAKRMADNTPLSDWSIGAWLDYVVSAASGAIPSCGQRVASILSGNLMNQPLLDLTGYYVITLDAENSISILDPSVNFAGRSSLYASLKLEGRGFDWIKTDDDTKLFVALAEQDKLAVVDLNILAVNQHITLPGSPTRLALQDDQRLLWVGYVNTANKQSGLAIIDTLNDKLIKTMSLPEGHHEFAFSKDGHYAYVSSRRAGTLSIINAAKLNLEKTIEVGGQPLSVVMNNLESILYVIDGENGRISRYSKTGEPIDTFSYESGLGPARLTADSRHLIALNPPQHRLHIIDARTGREKHRITISGRPYDILMSEQYLYIRTLDSEQMALITLASLDMTELTPQYIPVGGAALAAGKSLPVASSMGLTLDLAGAFIAAPAEQTLYHYMEGMNAPDSGIRAYGHTPMASMVIQRGLRQVAKGEYLASLKIPSSGRMVLALASEAPLIRECIELNVESTHDATDEQSLVVEWISKQSIKASSDELISFHIKVAGNSEFISEPSRLSLKLVPAHGGKSEFWTLVPHPNSIPGHFTASGHIKASGGYYVHVTGANNIKSTFAIVNIN